MTGTDDYADVSSPDGEPVAIWERVSTTMTRQDIASQTRDLRAFIGAGSYRVERVFRFEASAFHGDHAPEQAEMLADVIAGRYKTVVAAMTSRYERRGWQYDMYFALQLHLEYGARVVAIDDPSYGDMSTAMGGISTMLKAKSNHDYSRAISDNVLRKFRLMDSGGFHRGSVLSGYAAQCTTCGEFGCSEKSHAGCKRLVRHPVTSELVIQAFTDCATGTSTPKIKRAFKAANERYGLRGGLRLPASDDGVNAMLRRPEYSTGHHKPGNACRCTFQPLVSPAQQQAAVSALEGRRTGDNVTSRAISKDDYSGALWCAACGHDKPMYRIYSEQRNGTRQRRYVCKPSVGGCGKSFKADEADATLDAIMSSDVTPWWIPFTEDPNAGRDRALVAVNQELKDLSSQGLSEDAEDDRRAELRAERKRLQAMPDQPATTFARVKTDDNGKRLTQGDHWQMMTAAERRDALTAAGSDFPFAKLVSGVVVVELRPADTERA